MSSGQAYLFSNDHRAAYEMFPMPLGIFQYINGKVVTLLVSDGLCDFIGKERNQLVDHFNNNMFGNVHPDDAEMLARLGYRFATKQDSYDITYRTKLYGQDEYRYVHAVGQFRLMEDGTNLAFIEYLDVTDSEQKLIQTLQEFESPKTRFFDENMGAMVVVSRKEKQLLYFNKAVCRMLPPKINYDSGMTFQQYFYNGFPNSMKKIFDMVDIGPKMIEEPNTLRNLEVNVISSTWNDEPAYTIYFYEYQTGNSGINQDTILRHKRVAFNNIMFTGSTNKLPFYQNGYKGFRVWNFTQNEAFLDEGHDFIYDSTTDGKTFDNYINCLHRKSIVKEDEYFFNICQKELMIFRYESRSYPRNRTITLQTKEGRIYIALEITMMKSPDSGEIFIKVWEENVTDELVADTMMMQTIKNEHDYIAYIDLSANKCRVIFGKAQDQNRKNFDVNLNEYFKSSLGFKQLARYFGQEFSSQDGVVNYINMRCGKNGSFLVP